MTTPTHMMIMTVKFDTQAFVDIAHTLIPVQSPNRTAIIDEFTRRMETTRHSIKVDELKPDYTEEDVKSILETGMQKIVSDEFAAMLADDNLAHLFTQEQP